MTQSKAWLKQAASDLTTAQVVLKDSVASTYCQSLSKYQQAVEKSAKAIVAAVKESGVSFNIITKDHDPSRQIEALVASRVALGEKLLKRVRRIFPDNRIGQIRQLCSLAPQGYPNSGQPFARNTEYPYNDPQGNWIAPASSDSFSLIEVRDAHQLAWLIKNQVDRFTEALRLRP